MSMHCTEDGCALVCCGTCIHHSQKLFADDEWVCSNPDADNYSLETEYMDGENCDSYEARE